MPRPAKGARLWLRKARTDAEGNVTHDATWIILDAGKQHPTRLGADDRAKAEQALAAHIAGKYEAPRRDRDLSAVPVADVIAIFLKDTAQTQARPEELARRCVRLLEWWGDKTLSDVSAHTCRQYVESRKNAGGSRRDLEDLRAAINHHAKERLHRGAVTVTLPAKGRPRDRWLTRDEAARLLWFCWRTKSARRLSNRPKYKRYAPLTDRYPLRHIARFILIGLYTGTRASAIASASWAAASGRSYVDLERGLFYRLKQGAVATNKRQTPVPLPGRLLAHIRRWHEMGDQQFLVEFGRKPVKSVKTGFERAVSEVQLPGRVTPHTLRHTAATWLMQAGVPIWEAAGFLGMSAKMLEETYGHHHPDHMRGAANALNLGANKSPTKTRDQTRTPAARRGQK